MDITTSATVRLNLPQPGDILIRKGVEVEIYDHYGVYLGAHPATGVHWVYEVMKGHGDRVSTFQDFLQGKPYRIERKPEKNLTDIAQRVREKMAQPKAWDLLEYNCEHGANEVVHGVPRSSQIQKGIAFTTLGLFALWLAKSE